MISKYRNLKIILIKMFSREKKYLRKHKNRKNINNKYIKSLEIK